MQLSKVLEDRPTLRGVVGDFPHIKDTHRIENYGHLRNLRYDRHEEAFFVLQRAQERARAQHPKERSRVDRKFAAITYLCENLLAVLSEDTANRLWLSMPTIEVTRDTQQTDEEAEAPGTAPEEQDDAATVLQRLLEDSDAHTLFLDATDLGTVLGDIVLKTYRPGDKPWIIDTVDPSCFFRGEDYFPEYRRRNPDDRCTKFPMIATPFKAGWDDWYVLLEIHEPGCVLYRAYRWDVSLKEGEQMSFAVSGELGEFIDHSGIFPTLKDYDTGLDEPTCMKIKVERGDDQFWGASLFTQGLQSMQDQINFTISTLVSHMRKLLSGGHLILPQSMMGMVDHGSPRSSSSTTGADFGRGGGSAGGFPEVDAEKLDCLFEGSQDQGVTRHIAVSPQYEGAFKLLDGLVRLFSVRAKLFIPRLFDEMSAPESGRAMRLQHSADVARIKRATARVAPVARFIKLILKLRGFDADRVSISWEDPFPSTDLEKAEVQAIRTGGKQTMSTRRSLLVFDNLSPAETDAEINELQQESHAGGYSVLPGSAFDQQVEGDRFEDEDVEDDEAEAEADEQ